MLEQLKYINHQNEAFEFGKDGIFVNTNDLHDYEWSVTKQGNKISSLDRSGTIKRLPIIILTPTEASGINARNKLTSVIEKDAVAMQYGKIVIGDYYLRCFVVKSEKQNYQYTKRYITVNLTLDTDLPYWIKETTFAFKPDSAGSTNDPYLDFAFDYPIDYASGTSGGEINNTGLADSNFRMYIYGACANPAVYVGNHSYQVNCTVDVGEYLTIDSTTKQIYITAVDGTTTNAFNARSRESYVFQKIPVGNMNVAKNGDFGVDIVLMDERSEPKWI